MGKAYQKVTRVSRTKATKNGNTRKVAKRKKK